MNVAEVTLQTQQNRQFFYRNTLLKDDHSDSQNIVGIENTDEFTAKMKYTFMNKKAFQPLNVSIENNVIEGKIIDIIKKNYNVDVNYTISIYIEIELEEQEDEN